MVRPFICICFLLILFGCAETPPKGPSSRDGSWLIFLHAPSDSIPVRVIIDDSLAILVNSDERIPCRYETFSKDSFRISTPVFSSELLGKYTSPTTSSGIWINHNKPDYQAPFTGYMASFPLLESPIGESYSYEVTFSPETPAAYKAIGLFQFDQPNVVGTFLTETGDFRFLQGTIEDSSMVISCFDGAHAFMFKGNVRDNAITKGVFLSGKHWEESWRAIRNEKATLLDPDSITYFNPGVEPRLSVSVTDMTGSPFLVSDSIFRNKVTIVQVFGSWCPNCMDESLFYRGLYQKYHGKGLQIIPVAFERDKDLGEQVKLLEKYRAELDLPYPSYIGGIANKDEASAKFSMVNRISSFPTSFFIDRNGVVRRIHTGFYGPGTGLYYDEYCEETLSFVEGLLSE